MLHAVTDKNPRAAQIAAQNDLFRRALIDPIAALDAARLGIHGRKLLTRGVSERGDAFALNAQKAVALHSDFTEDNDPHGERDFGGFTLTDDSGQPQRLLWKIDYYDAALEYGSEDPADPRQTRRVLTIMLASEY